MHGNNTIIYDDDVVYFNYGYLTTSLSLTETPTRILSNRDHLILNLRAHNVLNVIKILKSYNGLGI